MSEFEIENTISFYKPLGLIICLKCSYGVRIEQLLSHFIKKHRFSRNQSKRIDRETREILSRTTKDEASRTLTQKDDLLNSPIPNLELYTDGLQCQLGDNCQQIYRREDDIKKHCRTKHGWKSNQSRGRPAKDCSRRDNKEEIWQRVYCQRLYPSGPNSSYFRVELSSDDTERIKQGNSTIWERLDEEYKITRTTAENAAIRDEDPYATNRWLRRTGWAIYLEGLDRQFLIQTIQKPSSDSDPIELWLYQIVRSLFQKAHRLVTTKLGWLIRFGILFDRTNIHTSTTPFRAFRTTADLDRAIGFWQQLLVFFYRRYKDEKDRTKIKSWPKIKLNQRQKELLKLLFYLYNNDNEIQSLEEDNEDSKDSDDSIEDKKDEKQGKAEILLRTTEDASLKFFISLLDQRLVSDEYESPLYCILAIFGLSYEGWKKPQSYTPLQSRVLRTARLLVIQSATQARPRRKRHQGPESFKIQEMIERFFVRGTYSPIESILNLRAYGMKIASTTASEGLVEWQNENTILYRTIEFSMDEFRTFVRTLLVATGEILNEKLLFSNILSDPLVNFRLSDLRDDPTEITVGWSFVRDVRNKAIFNDNGFDNWLSRQIRSYPQLAKQFIVRDQLEKGRCDFYLRQVEIFRTKLAILVHLTGGQPARIPELLSVRWRNGQNGELRNIFIKNGLVMIITTYHKGLTTTDKIKLISRFLPLEVSWLVVRFVLLVIPWVEKLEASLESTPNARTDAFLWPGRRESKEERIRTSFLRITKSLLGQEINVKSYRHIAIAISRRYLARLYHFRNKDIEYRTKDGEESSESDEEEEDILAAQATHTAWTDDAIYARTIQQHPGGLGRKQELFRLASIAWHEFLGLEEMDSRTIDNQRARIGNKRGASLSMDERHSSRTIKTIENRLLSRLREWYGDTAEFRTKQISIIQSVIAEQSPILAILPTGGGKSLLFLLPISLEDSSYVTIVIVPLLALRTDLRRRCGELGIACQAWHADRTLSYELQVVLVTIEGFASDGFVSFLNRLRTAGRLKRIVVDECHQILEDHTRFRPSFFKLDRLVRYQVPLLFLTATLPAQREGEFWKRLRLDDVQATIFRTSTNRANIGYEILRTKEENKVIEQIVLKGNRTIIYCNTIIEVQRLARDYSWWQYYSSYKEKEQDLQAWIEDREGVIVATNALGLGIDLPDIRTIIFKGVPESLTEFVQASGRVGRDGSIGRAIIIFQEEKEKVNRKTEKKMIEWINDRTRCRRGLLEEIFDGRMDRIKCKLEEMKCDNCLKNKQIGLEEIERAIVIGEEQVVVRVREQNRIERKRIRDLAIGNERVENEWLERQLGRLLERRTRCFLCDEKGEGHEILECPNPNRTRFEEMKRSKIEESIRYERYTGCYSCGVPQAICERFERNERGFGRKDSGICQYGKVLYEIVGGLAVDGRTKEREELGLAMKIEIEMKNKKREEIKIEEIVRRGGEKIRWLGIETNRLFYGVIGII